MSRRTFYTDAGLVLAFGILCLSVGAVVAQTTMPLPAVTNGDVDAAVTAACANGGALLRYAGYLLLPIIVGKIGLLMKSPGEAGTIGRAFYQFFRVCALSVGPMVPALLQQARMLAQQRVMVQSAGKAMVVLLALSLGLALSACSGTSPDLSLQGLAVTAAPAAVAAPAATATPAAAPGSSGTLLYRADVALAKKAVPDLQAAIVDATNHKDDISLACWTYGLTIAQAIAGGNLNPVADLPGLPVGLFSGLQAARDVRMIIQAGPNGLLPNSFYMACGPYLAQEGMSVVNFLGRVGITIGTGGAAAAIGL